MFLDPGGHRLLNVPRRSRGDCDRLVAGQRRAGVTPASDATVPGWMGDRLDLGYAVDALLDFTERPDPDAFPRERQDGDGQGPFAAAG